MTIAEAAANARKASYGLMKVSAEQRAEVLARMRELLEDEKERVFEANRADMERAREEGLAGPLLKRLSLNGDKLETLRAGLQSLIALRDPLGHVTLKRELTEGLVLERRTCPIGVIGVIFESRPDALVQIGSLCVKSGNAILLKGGREAAESNRALFEILKESGRGILPEGWCALMESRDDVNALLKEEGSVDLIIPRGGNAFIRYIMDHTRIPVMGHADGICHTYIDADADTETAVKVTVDAKTQALAVCNATETILVHEAAAERVLPALFAALRAKGVEIRGCERTREIADCLPAQESDWRAEYLDAIVSVKVVPSLEAAVEHINRFGSHHTDAIITENDESAEAFFTMVDSAGVYRNCSTRFADGYRYGFGAEVGISTSKLHARGPVGVEGLCTYKYVLRGSGQTVEDMETGRRKYTHRDLE